MPQSYDEISTDTWPSTGLQESNSSINDFAQETILSGLNVGPEIAAELQLELDPNTSAIAPAQKLGLPEFMLLAGVVLLLGVGLLCLWQVRGRIARRKQATPPPRKQITAIKMRQQEQTADAAMQGELHGLAQKLCTQMTNRAKHLELLLDRADQRIEELTKQLTLIKDQSLISNEMSDDHPTPSTPPDPVLDPLSQSVHDLADSGQSAIQIAQSLDEQVGKVELILALRNTTTTATGLLG